VIIPAIGFVLGIILALYMPAIDYTYSKYLAIAILACLDSVFGGISALMEERFNIHVFTSGFAGNALLAVGLAYLGEKLGLDLYLAAVFVFGNRIFLNFAIIRRYLLNKFKKQDNI
jgi:small basic protein